MIAEFIIKEMNQITEAIFEVIKFLIPYGLIGIPFYLIIKKVQQMFF